jgi:GNAT superfamily N-acetyltransferase
MTHDPNVRLRVTYLEILAEPPAPADRAGPERIAAESLAGESYLELYRRVGGPLRWDTRLIMPRAELDALLSSGRARCHVMRDSGGRAIGFCEFDLGAFPEIELKHFGLVPEAQGRGLGPWLLSTALREEWRAGARRIWLHTDTWDHPAAMPVYERAGFRVYDLRYQEPEGL